MVRTLAFLGVGGLILPLGSLASGCSSQQFRERARVGHCMTTLEKHLQAPTVEAAIEPLAAEFRFFPDGPDAPGLDRDQTAALLRFEYTLHRKITTERVRETPAIPRVQVFPAINVRTYVKTAGVGRGRE